MRKVYIVSDNIYSPLGVTATENFAALRSGRSGIAQQENRYAPSPYMASLFPGGSKPSEADLTAFESLLVASIRDALKDQAVSPSDPRTAFILSSTKGNISLLEEASGSLDLPEKISLPQSARAVARAIGFSGKPLVVSHACISGVLAMITGMRLIRSGRYDHAIVSGADLITQFVLSGFQSFLAISNKPCRPFDRSRDGITLGEGAATVILSATASPVPGAIEIAGGSVSNDANHISGPSRTGEELFLAISRALSEARVSPEAVDFISAHGTATRYNDEMEAKAINLAGLQTRPLNSLKGYYGHTLGAAGLIESVISLHSLRENLILPTMGYSEPGTEKPVQVAASLIRRPLKTCLKTASGFGGCNAAIVLQKN